MVARRKGGRRCRTRTCRSLALLAAKAEMLPCQRVQQVLRALLARPLLAELAELAASSA
jgi:hypothetical protein